MSKSKTAKPITQEEWNQLSFGQREYLSYLFRWYVFKSKVKKSLAGLAAKA